jgi:catechol 2,3-dioxygenase-like lactoylglutathione lyase family enzyme
LIDPADTQQGRRSRLTRREALSLAGAAALWVARPSAQEAALEFDGIDHVEFYVSQVQRTRDFLAAVFGTTLLVNATAAKSYVKVGSGYFAFERPRTEGGPLTTDHVSMAIRNIEMPRVHALLDARGIAYRDYPSGRDTAILDGDGISTQLSPPNGWSLLKPPNFAPDAIVLREEPVFRPTGIEHVLLNVTDPDAAARFYAKVFGVESRRLNDRSWFQVGRSRLGLQKTADGDHVGVHHVGVAAEPFAYDVAVARLRALAATVERPEIQGAPSFRDPDGMLVQVKARD